MYACYMYSNDFKECRWNVWLWRTIAIFQLTFGSFGSVLSIMILSRKRLQKYSTTVYLLVLAISDLCALWTSFLANFLTNGFGIDLKALSQFACKTVDPVGYTAAGYSIWLLVLVTIERMMLTRFPIISKSKLTKRSALITVLVCLAVTTGVFAHMSFGFEIKDIGSEEVSFKICVPSNKDFETFYNHTFPLILLFIFTLMPIILLVISNSLIIASLVFQRRKLRAVNPVGQNQLSNTCKKTKSSTRIIITISTFFIVTTLPYMFKKAFESKLPPTDDEEMARRILFESIFVFIISSNHTFNFILYCVGGTIFYEEFRKLIQEAKQKMSETFSSSVVTTVRRSNTTDMVPTSNGVMNTTEF